MSELKEWGSCRHVRLQQNLHNTEGVPAPVCIAACLLEQVSYTSQTAAVLLGKRCVLLAI
jgi:hypothetical protein